MTQQGQHVEVKIYRTSSLPDDRVGGAQQSMYTEIATARARLQSRANPLVLRAQGITGDDLCDAHVTPATTDVQRDDILIAQAGNYAHVRWLVTGVQSPSMDIRSPAAHLRVQLSRTDEGRMVDVLL